MKEAIIAILLGIVLLFLVSMLGILGWLAEIANWLWPTGIILIGLGLIIGIFLKFFRKGGGKMRVIFALFVWVLLLFLTTIGGTMLIEFISLPLGYGTALGCAVWLILMAYIHRWFMVSVPEITGLNLFNVLTGKMRGIGAGLHFRYPWEQVEQRNYIELRLAKTTRPDETYPALDGPVLKVSWFFQYRPRVEWLPRYVAVSQEVIDTGLTDVGSRFLSRVIGSGIDSNGILKWPTAEECKKHQDEIETYLKDYFEKKLSELEEEGVNLGIPIAPKEGDFTLEFLYGIDLVAVGIADMDYEEIYQKVRSSRAVVEKLNEIATNLKKGNITDREALDAAMVVNKNITRSIQENVQRITGEGTEAVLSFIMALAQGKGGEKR